MKTRFLSVVILASIMITPIMSNAQQYLAGIIKSGTSVGVVFTYDEVKYGGLQYNHDVMNRLWGYTMKPEDFRAFEGKILDALKAAEGMQEVKVINAKLNFPLKEGERATALQLMNSNGVDPLIIVNVSASFVHHETSGDIPTSMKEGYNARMRAYFKGWMMDEETKVADASTGYGFLSSEYIRGSRTEGGPTSSQQLASQVEQFKDESFRSHLSVHSAGGNIEDNFITTGIRMDGDRLVVNLGKDNGAVAGRMRKLHTIVGIAKVNGDIPETYWEVETEYYVQLVGFKVENVGGEESVLSLKRAPDGLDMNKLIGMPLARGSLVAGHVQNPRSIAMDQVEYLTVSEEKTIENRNRIVQEGENTTMGQGLRSVKAQLKSGPEEIKRDRPYDGNASVYPPTTVAENSKPNVPPKKEKGLMAKIRRLEADGNKIGIVFLPDYTRVEIPDPSASPTGLSTAPDCNMDRDGKADLPADALGLGEKLVKQLNDGFGTSIFELIDEAQLPQRETTMLGRMIKQGDFANTQYKIAGHFTLQPRYQQTKAGTTYSTTIMIQSALQLFEYNNDSGKRKVAGTSNLSYFEPMGSVKTDNCLARFDEFESAAGKVDPLIPAYISNMDKKVQKFVEKQSK